MEKIDNDFELKSMNKINKMSLDERLEYYRDYRNFVMSLEYDEEENRQNEERYLKTLRFLINHFNPMFNPKYFGVNDENDEPMIVVSNHLDSFDQLLISPAYPEKVLHYMIASTLLKPKNLMVGHLYTRRGAFTVDRNDPRDRTMAIPKALIHLLRGQSAVILPEGTRTIKYGSDGTVQKFKEGAVLASMISGLPIKPMAINNNFKKDELYVNKGSKIYIPEDANIFEATHYLEDVVRNLWQENKDNGAVILTKKPKQSNQFSSK